MRSVKSKMNIIEDLWGLLEAWKEVLNAIPAKKRKESMVLSTFCNKFAHLANILEKDLNELEKSTITFEAEVIDVIRNLENEIEPELKHIIFPELPVFLVLFGIQGQLAELRKKHDIGENEHE